MPSPYVVAFLFAGCREIHRIGGHVLDRAVLELFAWELLEKVSFQCLAQYNEHVYVLLKYIFFVEFTFTLMIILKTWMQVLTLYEKFMSHPSFMNSRVSEKGLLQLLFDLKTVADVLSGGKEVLLEKIGAVETETSLSKSQIARKRWVDKLLDELHNHIDPIDWAT